MNIAYLARHILLGLRPRVQLACGGATTASGGDAGSLAYGGATTDSGGAVGSLAQCGTNCSPARVASTCSTFCAKFAAAACRSVDP
jgi:hypothetical protein